MVIERILDRGNIINTSKAINTDWFDSNIAHPGKHAGPVKHTIFISLEATDAVVKLLLDNSDASLTNYELDFNGGTALTAGALYAFDIVIFATHEYNIQHETATQDVTCWIVESRNSEI